MKIGALWQLPSDAQRALLAAEFNNIGAVEYVTIKGDRNLTVRANAREANIRLLVVPEDLLFPAYSHAANLVVANSFGELHEVVRENDNKVNLKPLSPTTLEQYNCFCVGEAPLRMPTVSALSRDLEPEMVQSILRVAAPSALVQHEWRPVVAGLEQDSVRCVTVSNGQLYEVTFTYRYRPYPSVELNQMPFTLRS